MYCKKCGQEISENAKFCNYCGAQQNQTAQQYTEQYMAPGSIPNQSPYQPPYQAQTNMPYSQVSNIKPKNKNGKKIIISIAVIVVALVVGRLIGGVVMAPSLSDSSNTGSSYTSSTESNDDNKSNSEVSGNILSNSDNNTDTYSSDTQTDNEATGNSSSSTVNSEYEEIFSSRNIVDSFAGFLMLDSASFAKVNEDGMIDKLEYGYDGEMIKEMVNTVYFPISDYTDAQKKEFDTTIKEDFSELENLNCCTINYTMGNNYYIITAHFTDLDNLENVQTLSELGGIMVSSPDSLITMQKTEESLLSNGYVKK